MKVWMVLALLAMGLGCSQEPEQWSQAAREDMVEGCVQWSTETYPPPPEMVVFLDKKGVTPRDLCRCSLYENEREHTESDYRLMSDEERLEAFTNSYIICVDKLLGLTITGFD